MDRRSILIIDRDSSFRQNAGRFLTERGFTVCEAENAQAGLEEVYRSNPAFVLMDLAMARSPEFDLVDRVLSQPNSPGVVCVAQDCRVPDVVAAIKAGVLDVLERPVDGEKLVRILDRAAQNTADLAPPQVSIPAARALRLTRDPKIDHLVVESDVMRAVLARVERMTNVEVLVLEAEPGVGQEGVAKHWHACGSRNQGPFVRVASTIEHGVTPEDALFGASGVPSAFAQAKGGVVYIESLTALGVSGQERLAKLLQGLAAARVSGTTVRWPPMVICVDRPIAVDLEAGRIRRDLVSALSQAVVRIPPLRERKKDIPELIHRTVNAIQTISGAPGVHIDPVVIEALVKRDWEGNVPELVAAVTKAAAYADDSHLVLDLTAKFDEPPPPVVVAPPPPPEPAQWSPTLDAEGQVQPYDVYEAEIFRFALENAGGCVSRAAELLGVGRATMYRKMRAYKIKVPPVSERAISRSRRPKKRRTPEAHATAAPIITPHSPQDLAS
ncbi:MAG: response regulator [Myxococcota bacterium]